MEARCKNESHLIPVADSEKRDYGEKKRYTGEERKELLFLPFAPCPAAHLEVVVERRHFEYALAVAQLVVGHLNNIRERLKDKHGTERNQDHRDVVGEGQRRNGSAEKQASCIPHEDLCGVEVISEETEQASYHGGGKYPELQIALPPEKRKRNKEQKYRDRGARGEPVHTVRDVDGVYRAHYYECGEEHIRPVGDVPDLIEKWNIEIGLKIARSAHYQNKYYGCCKLEQKFRIGVKPEILFVLYLLPVV